MDMIGFLGKKVELTCKDRKKFSGYVFEVSEAEDSDIGCASVDIAMLDKEAVTVIPIEDIESVVEDKEYRMIDFCHDNFDEG